MALSRKNFLQEAGWAGAGAALGAYARGLFGRRSVGERGPSRERPRGGAAARAGSHAGARPAERTWEVGDVSFSQCGEDVNVQFALRYMGAPAKITYLDIGANDPMEQNNTYYFYRRGHRGVLVEPNAGYCDLLRAVRPEDVTLAAGIGVDGRKEADYYVMSFPALNTFSREEAELQLATSRGRVALEDVVKVPLLDINDVMRDHLGGAPTFLSIDTEGMDLAILRTIDFERFRPTIICAETLIVNTTRARPEIAEFLEGKDYVVRGGSIVNAIFIDAAALEKGASRS